MKSTRMYKLLFVGFSFLLCAFMGLMFVGCSARSELKKASKNLSAYSISANITEDYTIQASQNISYVNSTGTTLSDICLHLYPRAFRDGATIRPYTNLNEASCFPTGTNYGTLTVSKVNVNKQSANFEYAGQDEDILKINLPSALEKKKTISIDIDFEVIIPECTNRLGHYTGTINIGNWYPIVCAWNGSGWDTSPYYSTGDPFYSVCANYNVSVTYPEQYSCYATGELTQSSANSSSYKALAVRDFAIVLSSKASATTQEVDGTKVTYVGYTGDEDVDALSKISAKALGYYNKTFGEYPYSSLVVIKSAFMHGGMEFPNLVIISDSITDAEEYNKVIVHEIAHQWWYGVVGNNQVAEAWLDESLAEYSTCLFFEDNADYGITYADLIRDSISSYLIYVDVISSLSGKVNTAMNLAINQYTSEYEYTYMIYVKGVIMFDTLRDAVGKKNMLASLKRYYKENKFSVATGNSLISAFKKCCHKDLDGFFDGWLTGNSIVGEID